MRVSRLAALVAMFLVARAQPAQALDPMNWDPRNHAVLERLMRDVGKGSPGYKVDRPPYAVFDWDQTSAFLDCQEVTMRHQVRYLAFRLSPEEFARLLPPVIGNVRSVVINDRTIPLEDIHADLIADYQYLKWRGASIPLSDLKQTLQYQDFAAKLPAVYDAYCATPGIGPSYAFPWITYLLGGHSTEQVHQVAKAAIEEALAAPVQNQTWVSPESWTSRSGSVRYAFRTGLRVLPEMQDLMARLRAAGIDVYIVSASLKAVVETFAGPGRFGYNVPADHVVAMETAVRDGVMLPAYKPGWVPTVGPGKVQAIRQVLGHRGDPVLVAGDSDGDYEMLTGFAGMKVALVVNRLKGGPIGRLCRQAVAEKDKEAPRFLLQGRNENTGLFIPTMATVRFGRSEPELLPEL
jgi:phosphoserine phosphatase